MKLCIFDPAHNLPGLKMLFPESHYYAIEPCPFFTYSAINHMNKQEFKNVYSFEYLTDINHINSYNYDTLFIILPLLDCIEGHSMTKDYGVRIIKLVEMILENSTFTKVCLFDTYDYDYDPVSVYKNNKIDYYFKRNYNKMKNYSSNVYPFPYMMFVTKCVLTILLEEKEVVPIEKRKDGVFWCGTIFKHENSEFGIVRDRTEIFYKLKDSLDIYNTLSQDNFISTLRNYTIGLDLYGVGDPNKRTFELIANDVLVLTNRTNLEWGFNNGDSFSEETIFTDSQDYFKKVELLKDKQVYIKCLKNQRFLKQKYMNKESIRNYILSKTSLQ
jgi:hypothetical protein